MQTIAVSAISALLLSFSGRPWGTPFFALVALVPFLYVLQQEKRIWRGALASYILSLPVFVVGFEGLVVKSHTAFYLVCLLLSLWFLIPGAITIWFQKKFNPTISLLLFCLSWITIETFSGSYKLWHNWANPLSIGLSQVDSPLIQLAYWAGLPLVAFCVLLINICILELIRKRWKLSLTLLCTIAIFVFATSFFREPILEAKQSLKVGIVQGNLTNHEINIASSDFIEQENLVNHYSNLTKSLRNSYPEVDVVVWPEGATTFYSNYLHNQDSQSSLLPKNIALLTGGYDYQPRENALYTNSIMFWDGQHHDFVYDKQALVPVYESKFSRGKGYRGNLVKLKNVETGMGICWESLYPELSRQSVNLGADLLIYFSDDSFAGNSVTPWYHMRTTAVRAIESGRYAVFASQAGPSGVFSPRGKQLLATQPGEGYWLVEIPINKQNVITPFTRFGNWFGWSCVAITLFALISSIARATVFSRAKVQVP
jgi:apolipoprotein N-acyltransferase